MGDKNGGIRGRPPSGFVIYEGPSLLDGSPIVAVALVGKSSNTKTGAMLQTYILRADVDPITANRTGADVSICGECPLRGIPRPGATSGTAAHRGCYVTLMHGPRNVYATFRRGRYPVLRGGHYARDVAALGRARRVRLGTYGDPAAVPSYVWDALLSEADGHTGYTHQYRNGQSSADRGTCMASVSTEAEARESWDAGWRTFRIIADVANLVAGREILCPASAEAGKRTTCATCNLCGGANIKAKSIAIVAHGAGKNHAKRSVTL